MNWDFKDECGGTLGENNDEINALSGWLTNPGYPFTYPKNVTCNWLIRVSPNKRIYIRLVHLELSKTVGLLFKLYFKLKNVFLFVFLCLSKFFYIL